MARAKVTKHYNSFLNGKVSDGNEFSAPENAVRDSLNMELQQDDSFRRRRGLTFDTTSFYWQSTSTSFGNPDEDTHTVMRDWVVTETNVEYDLSLVCIDNTASVFRKVATGSLELTKQFIGTLELIDGTALSTQDGFMSVATNANYMVATHPFRYPHTVTKDVGLNDYTTTHFTPKIRDLEGVDDGLDIDHNVLVYAHTFSSANFSDNQLVVGATSGFKAVILQGGTGAGDYQLLYIGTGGFTNGETVNEVFGAGTGVITSNTPASGEETTEEHYYNLLNQGWTETNIRQYATDTGTLPSNAQIMSSGKNSSGDFTSATLDQIDFGQSPAPRGRFILNAFAPDRVYTDPFNGGTITLSYPVAASGFSAASFFAGRLCLAGGYSSYNGDKLYISQLLTNDVTDPAASNFLLDKFHTVNDITSENLNETLPTDGFVQTVPGADRIVDTAVLGKGLIILATNGVWFLRGTDVGFSAQDRELVKIGNKGAISQSSVISADDFVAYWSKSGIEIVVIDNTGYSAQVIPISDGRISKEFRELSDAAKYSASGHYDKYRERISWVYDSDGATVSVRNARITYDLRTKSFTEFDYSVGQEYDTDKFYYVAGITQRPITATSDADAPELQFAIVLESTPRAKVAFVFESERGFFDWDDSDNSYSSYLETWPEHLGEPMIDKKIDAMMAFFKRTETQFVDNGSGGVEFDYPSSCLFTAKWNWTTLDVGEWTTEQEIYRFERNYVAGAIGDPFDYGYSVIKTLNDVSGEGKAVAFRFEADDYKDMHLIGFSVVYSGESAIEG